MSDTYEDLRDQATVQQGGGASAAVRAARQADGDQVRRRPVLVARFWRGHVAPALSALAAWAAAFVAEACFRVALAFEVLAGRVPQRTDKRPWIRSVEAPILADVRDWTTDLLIFPVLVWPPLGADGRDSHRIHRQRAEDVVGAFAKGSTEQAWSTSQYVDHGLVWVHEREVWVDGDGHAYDGSRFGSRRPHAA